MNRYRIYCCRLMPEGQYMQTVWATTTAEALALAKMVALAPMVERVEG